MQCVALYLEYSFGTERLSASVWPELVIRSPSLFPFLSPPSALFSTYLDMSSFYSLSAPLRKGTLDFSSFKNKVVVIVNVASACGKTPQYSALQKLYENHKEQGLEIVGFPSNQFKVQTSRS
jgi:hypothetical protein